MDSPAKRQKPNYHGTVLHSTFAASSRPVQLIHELGLENEIEIVTLDKIAATRSEEHLKLNPNGRVPVYFEGERAHPSFTLVESVAIVMYLLEKYDKEHNLLLPPTADAHKRGKMYQFLFYSPAELYQVIGQLYELNAVPEEQRDKVRIEKIHNKIKSEFLPFVERELGSKKFLLGDEYTIADLIISYDLLGFKWLGLLDEKVHPVLGEYYARLSERASFKATFPM